MKKILTKILNLLVLLAHFNFLQANQNDCLTQCCSTLVNREKQTYIFFQDTGHFIGGQSEWIINTYGYSGQGIGYLNPQMQCVETYGPLPMNTYTVGYCKDTMHQPPVTRPCSFYLSPDDQSKMCGRKDFFIHGCQCCTDGDFSVPPIIGCSAGCVVIAQPNRLKIRVGDKLIVKNKEPKICKKMGKLCLYFHL